MKDRGIITNLNTLEDLRRVCLTLKDCITMLNKKSESAQPCSKFLLMENCNIDNPLTRTHMEVEEIVVDPTIPFRTKFCEFRDEIHVTPVKDIKDFSEISFEHMTTPTIFP